MQRIPGRRHDVTGKSRARIATFGNDAVVAAHDGDSIGDELGMPVGIAEPRHRRALLTQPDGHPARVRIVHQAFHGPQRTAGDDGGVDAIE